MKHGSGDVCGMSAFAGGVLRASEPKAVASTAFDAFVKKARRDRSELEGGGVGVGVGVGFCAQLVVWSLFEARRDEMCVLV